MVAESNPYPLWLTIQRTLSKTFRFSVILGDFESSRIYKGCFCLFAEVSQCYCISKNRSWTFFDTQNRHFHQFETNREQIGGFKDPLYMYRDNVQKRSVGCPSAKYVRVILRQRWDMWYIHRGCSLRWINHISTRCLKITGLFFIYVGEVSHGQGSNRDMILFVVLTHVHWQNKQTKKIVFRTYTWQ